MEVMVTKYSDGDLIRNLLLSFRLIETKVTTQQVSDQEKSFVEMCCIKIGLPDPFALR